MADNKYAVDYDKLGRASCKKCKQKLTKGELRVAKVTANFFHEGEGVMKQYHHPSCIFETFIKARATTKIIEGPDDLDGWANLEDEDKDKLRQLITETLAKKGSPKKKPAAKKSPAAAAGPSTPKASTTPKPKPKPAATAASLSKQDTMPGPSCPTPPPVKDDEPVPESRDFSDPADKDNSFRQFRRVCADLADVGSYIEKTNIVKKFITRGSSGAGFRGDMALYMKLLLPGEKGNKTVYNLNNKQLVKIFSQVFALDHEAMIEDLEQGDVAETVRIFFEKSRACPPHKKAILSIHDVDKYLRELSLYTKEDDQQRVLTKIARRCTANDLKMVVRLIKHDLRINAGAKHILEALDPNAYEAFQASRDLKDVVERVRRLKEDNKAGGMSKKLSIKAMLMTPVLPMLAEACKSVEFAFKRCPNGMYAEIKYDGERVQLHKQGDKFSYFSRSLKPVLPHKVSHFSEWIPKAFPSGDDLILDAEVLLIDTKTSKPLPFGTLGVHKKAQFSDANVCLFVFDILHYNGDTLMERPIRERRKYLRKVMQEVPNRILYSEMTHIKEPGVLRELMMKTFREGLEGLVLKDLESVYEPGKRHWLKVKKDYLAEGAMADSADLVMLGAYYGTGSKGGLMSVFLMGCYDVDHKRWVTVTKCHCGFDDKTLDRLQKTLEDNVEKISQDKTRIPGWLHMNKSITPDFVTRDPRKAPVWEITGAEFTKSESHTADGISIRFPRMTKMRDDKDWTNHTDLKRLKLLYKKSKETSDMPDLMGGKSSSKSPSKPSTSAQPIKSESAESDDSDMETSNHSNHKRPADDDLDDIRPTKKVKLEVKTEVKTESPGKKPPCKYGAKCYQTNPDHFKRYSHHASSPVTNGNHSKPGTSAGPSSSSSSSSGPLPNAFSGITVCIPDGLKTAKQLKRYITAFDGDVVDEADADSATYVAVDNNDAHGSGRKVSIDWLWKCIKKKEILPK